MRVVGLAEAEAVVTEIITVVQVALVVKAAAVMRQVAEPLAQPIQAVVLVVEYMRFCNYYRTAIYLQEGRDDAAA